MAKWIVVPILGLALAGCALWPGGRGGLAVNVLQSSDDCGTQTIDAQLHYFAGPDAFGAWIKQHAIDRFRAGAASAKPVLVLELGKRPTSGYGYEFVPSQSRIVHGVLRLRVNWTAPGEKALVEDALTTPCVVFARPKGNYRRIVVIDRIGKQRAAVDIPQS